MIRILSNDLQGFQCGSAENRTFRYNSEDKTLTDEQDDIKYALNKDSEQFNGLLYGGITYSLLVEKDNKYIISSDNIKYRIRNNIVTLPIDLPEDSDRAGFLYYYKTIKSNDDLTFTYRIKDYYSSSFSNNTITCKVVKNNQILESNISLDFNSMGSNGTHYTLVVKSRYDEAAMTQIKEINGQQYYIYDFMIQLFDYENKQISFNSVPLVALDKLNDPTAEISIEPNESGAQSYYGTLKVSIKNQPKAYVLKITTEKPWPVESTSVQLTQYYPIPWAKNPAYFAAVPTCIIYDSLGTNPSYYKDPLSLYISNESGTGNNPLVSECHWEIEGEYISIKKETANGKAQLAPCNMYITNFNSYPILKCYNNNNKNDILWYQPIYVGQNRYGSTLLNEWDGGLEISEKDGTIMSTMIGAGSKDNNNTFSGVLMGNVTQSTGIEVESEDQITVPHTGIGLYGFHEGAQSFGFNVNGTAFIGKSGGGRVAFDGNNGFIYSSNWLNSNEFKSNGKFNYSKAFPLGEDKNTRTLGQGSQGMAIDLQNGHIDAYNFKLTGAGIELNANPSTGENHFIIGKKNGSKWVLDGTEPYLKYDANGNLEMKVNSLELTGTIGGPNLINNTAPREMISISGLDHWLTPAQDDETINPVGTVSTSFYEEHKKYCVVLYRNNNFGDKDEDPAKKILQYLGDDPARALSFRSGKYILSGQIYSDIAKTIVFRLGLSSNEGDENHPTYVDQRINIVWGWNDISLNFTIPNDNIIPYYFQAYDLSKDKNLVYFHHLKLERGTIATDWRISNQDIKDNYEEYATNETMALDQQLNQDIIFNRLIGGKDNIKGIYLVGTETGSKNLYINANYISTGILRSENWGGELKYNGIEISDEDYFKLTPAEKQAVTVVATDGMYINLNNGKIWSKNFNLNAWDFNNSQGLWLDSNPEKDTNYYLLVGNQNGSYIGYTRAGTLTVKVNDLYISNKSIDQYIDGKIPGQLTYTDIMTMIANGWEGIYAQDGKYYMSADVIKAGTLQANRITGAMSSNVTIGGWNINESSISNTYTTQDANPRMTYYTGMYSVWPANSQQTIANCTSKNWRFVVGSKQGGVANNPATGYTFNFGVTREGYLAAENAYIDGNIKIGSGAVYGPLLISGENGAISVSNGSNTLVFDANGIHKKSDITYGIKFDGKGRLTITGMRTPNIILGSTFIPGGGKPGTIDAVMNDDSIYVGNNNCTLRQYILAVVAAGKDKPPSGLWGKNE